MNDVETRREIRCIHIYFFPIPPVANNNSSSSKKVWKIGKRGGGRGKLNFAQFANYLLLNELN